MNNTNSDQAAAVSIIGIPFDDNSSFIFGAAKAPPKIIEALTSHSSNMCAESGQDLGESQQWRNLGEMYLPESHTAFKDIQAQLKPLLEQQSRIICLGGDHSISYPIVRATSVHFPNLNILHLDAHSDLYDSLDGNRYSHASPFARIMENQLAARLVQVGVRTMTPHQREQAEKFEVEVHEMKDGTPENLEFDGPVYLSLDVDCLDPAFAPGVSHYEPGGLSTRQVINLINSFKGQLVGADLVEFNPTRDPAGITGMVCAKLLKEIIVRMLDDL